MFCYVDRTPMLVRNNEITAVRLCLTDTVAESETKRKKAKHRGRCRLDPVYDMCIRQSRVLPQFARNNHERNVPV